MNEIRYLTIESSLFIIYLFGIVYPIKIDYYFSDQSELKQEGEFY